MRCYTTGLTSFAQLIGKLLQAWMRTLLFAGLITAAACMGPVRTPTVVPGTPAVLGTPPVLVTPIRDSKRADAYAPATSVVVQACIDAGGDTTACGGDFAAVWDAVLQSVRAPEHGVSCKSIGAEQIRCEFNEATTRVDAPSEADVVGVDGPARQASVTRGIALFGIGNPVLGVGAIHYWGRTPAGDWQEWFSTQNISNVPALPGDMFVCAGETGITLRSRPDPGAASLATLSDGTRVTVQEFTLAEPRSPIGSPGFGWYLVSSPQAGWLSSNSLASAAFKSYYRESACSFVSVEAPQDRAAERAATAAVMELYSVIPEADCASGDKEQSRCLSRFFTRPPTFSRGIAGFTIYSYGGSIRDEMFVTMGRNRDGSWQLWYEGPFQGRVYELPSSAVVCSEDEDVDLRGDDDDKAPRLKGLSKGSQVSLEEFVLTESGVVGGSSGTGWFRISSPQAGWVASSSVRQRSCQTAP